MIMITNAAMVHALARSSIISISFRSGAPFFPDALQGRIKGFSARFFFGSIGGEFGRRSLAAPRELNARIETKNQSRDRGDGSLPNLSLCPLPRDSNRVLERRHRAYGGHRL